MRVTLLQSRILDIESSLRHYCQRSAGSFDKATQNPVSQRLFIIPPPFSELCRNRTSREALYNDSSTSFRLSTAVGAFDTSQNGGRGFCRSTTVCCLFVSSPPCGSDVQQSDYSRNRSNPAAETLVQVSCNRKMSRLHQPPLPLLCPSLNRSQCYLTQHSFSLPAAERPRTTDACVPIPAAETLAPA